MEERTTPGDSGTTSVEVAKPDGKAQGEGVEVSLDVTVFAAKATAATGRAASKSSKGKHEESDSDFDSDSDDGFQVGTLSIKQDMSKVLSLRPLDPVWASSRCPSFASSSELVEASRSIPSRPLEASRQLSASSRTSAKFQASSSSARKNVSHKFSRSSFGESSEESDDSSIVADLPSKPPRSINGANGTAGGSERVAAKHFASMPAPRGTSAGFQEVRAVASMPTAAGQKVVFHKQATGRRLACTSSNLQAVAQASLTNQDTPLVGNHSNSIKAQVEAMQLEEMQRQWSQYDRDRGDRPQELAACGTEGCTIN